MISKALIGIATSAALLAATSAQAAAPDCITKPELRAVVAFALPAFAEGMVERCRSRLPSDAYLTTRGPSLVTGLKAGQEAAWPLARRAVGKMAARDGKGDMAMFEELPFEMVEPLFAGMIETRFVDGIKARDCEDTNNILKTLDPLKPENFVDLITEVMMVAGRDDKELNICRAA